jgi:hypothetical protein
MKKYFLLILSSFTLFACSRKTVPQKGTNGTIVNGNNTSVTTTNNANNNNATNTPENNVTIDTSSSVSNANAVSFLVITNGYGKIITQKDSLPADANVEFNTFQLSKGFSAQELSNLKARYKTIPPRVLYVNPQSQQQSARGTFYVLGKKFWYWKKKDGLFYLDEKYYL